MSRALHAIVLAGGRGTRFWPQSRASRPKQLLALIGERTMLQATIDRIEPLVAASNVWVVTGREHLAEATRQLPQIATERLLAEPCGRNTAAAIGLATRRIARIDSKATTVVLSADHHVAEAEAFRETLERAIDAASRGFLVTLGIEPTAPETGYGYIERGEPVADDVFRVRRFTEKPDVARAKRFVASGGYFWNSGIFVWTARSIDEALRAHLPETHEALRDIDERWADEAYVADRYPRLANVSIDVAVLEKAPNVAVVPARFGWDDLGTWTALRRLSASDAHGNVLHGRVAVVDSSGNLVQSDRVVALVGVENLVVIDTEDALLVCSADRVQDVKQVPEILAARGLQRHT